MLLSSSSLYVIMALTASSEVMAFSPSSNRFGTTAGSNTALQMKENNNIQSALTAAVIAASVWASPFTLMNEQFHPSLSNNNNMAYAKEMASGSGSRVNKDPESLLRYGLPIPNDKEIRKLQSQLEETRNDINSKRKGPAMEGIKKSRTLLAKGNSKFASACREPAICSTILRTMDERLTPLDQSLQTSSNALNGSGQEQDALDNASKIQESILKDLTVLEQQLIPKGYATPVPSDYDDLPQLKGGRVTVEFTMKKPDGLPYVIDANKFPTAKMTMVIDGFTAPVTGGNFVDLVSKGFYNNMKISRSDGFVVQTGDPDGDAAGYVGKPSKSVGSGPKGERLIPNEIFVKGDKGPFYETTIEDEGRGGQATILPFSSYGAMGWAREEYDANSGSSQFFWLLFDSDLTPAGKNVLDGRYPCFGYIVEGADFLRDTKEDDIIISAKITDGAEFLIQPKKGASAPVAAEAAPVAAE